MKASQVGKEPAQKVLSSGRCCECRKEIVAPWGRNGLHGDDWVCSSKCQQAYDAKYSRWLPPSNPSER